MFEWNRLRQPIRKGIVFDRMLVSSCPIRCAISQVKKQYECLIKLKILLFSWFWSFCCLGFLLVTMQAQKEAPPDMQCRDKFLVQSVIVPNGTTDKDLNQEMVSWVWYEWWQSQHKFEADVCVASFDLFLSLTGTLQSLSMSSD